MKIETMKLRANNETNASGMGKKKVFTALKSIQFEALGYPEMKVEDLSFCGCNKRDHEIDLFLNVRLSVSRKEFFELIKALEEDTTFWREEDLPCTIKIDVHKKKKMDYWRTNKNGKN